MIIKKWQRFSIHKYAYHTYVGDSLFNIDELTKYCKEPVFLQVAFHKPKDRSLSYMYMYMYKEKSKMYVAIAQCKTQTADRE